MPVTPTTVATSFINPPEVRYGEGARADVDAAVGALVPAGTPVLVVGDPALARSGLLTQVRERLTRGGHAADVFDQVSGEPDDATCAALATAVRSRDYGAVVGMGGGSAIDLAKIGAGLATTPGDVDSLVGVERLAADPLPVVAVPTTAGTGSEATKIAMVSLGGRKRIINDRRLVPRVAVLDPELTWSLPPAVTAASGLDALSHAVEALLSSNASVFTDRAAHTALELIANALPRAWADGRDRDARSQMLLAAYHAGLALNAGTVLGHSIAYTIANRCALPHGVTTAMALPYCLAYAAAGAADRIAEIERTVGAGESGGIYAWATALNRTLGVPGSLRDLGVDRSELAPLAVECANAYPRPNNPVPLDAERLKALYHFLWSGDIDGCVQAFGSSPDPRDPRRTT